MQFYYCFAWLPGVCLLGVLVMCAYMLLPGLREPGDDFALWEAELQGTPNIRARKKIKRQ